MGVVHDTAHHLSEVVEFRLNVRHSHHGMSHLWVASYVIAEALVKCEVLETLSVFHEFMTTIVKKGKRKTIFRSTWQMFPCGIRNTAQGIGNLTIND